LATANGQRINPAVPRDPDRLNPALAEVAREYVAPRPPTQGERDARAQHAEDVEGWKRVLRGGVVVR
jgi:hypothetical protein